MVVLLTIILITLYMGFFSRVTGGGFIDLPLSLENWLYALPYGVLCFIAALPFSGDVSNPQDYVPWLAGVLGFAGAYVGKRTGHGQYMDLGTWERKIKAERLDFIVKWFFGPDPNIETIGPGNYWRDVFGSGVTGLAVTIVPSIILCFFGYFLLAALISIGGFFGKVFAYIIGWSVYPKYPPGDPQGLHSPTHKGEFFTGIFAGIPLAYALVSLYKDNVGVLFN